MTDKVDQVAVQVFLQQWRQAWDAHEGFADRLQSANSEIFFQALMTTLDKRGAGLSAAESALRMLAAAKLKNADKADAIFRLLQQTLDGHGLFWYLRAVCQELAGDFYGACDAYIRAMEAWPDSDDIVDGLMTFLFQHEDVRPELSVFDHWLQYTKNVYLKVNLGMLYYRYTLHKPAFSHWASIVSEVIAHGDRELLSKLYLNMANACSELATFDAARQFCVLAKQAGASDFAFHSFIAGVYKNEGQVRQAIAHAEAALAAEPDTYGDVHSLLGECYLQIGDLPRAWRHHEQALNLAPGKMMFHFAASLTRMCLGEDLRPAWQLYESRWFSAATGGKSTLPWPEWQGEQGERLLVYGEQGLGDQLYWATLVPELKQYFREVVLVVNPKLVKLLQRMLPDIRVYPDLAESVPQVFEQFDCQIPMGSLSRVLRPTRSDFNLQQALPFVVDESFSTWLAERLPSGPLKVGVSWRSTDFSGARGIHYLTVDQLAPLWSVAGVQFVNLQYRVDPSEVVNLRQALGERFSELPEVDHFDDLVASASVMSACDIVIAPCNAIAALAGVLGKPVLMFASTPFDGWQLGQAVSPWAPAITRLGKPLDAGWDEVLAQITAIISQLATEKKS